MISIAPMIDISNHHFRSFLRIITKKATLYTEMKSADAILHNHHKLLPFHQSQHPIILQIGGSEPKKLAQAAKIGEQYGYDGINLNVGCPSSRVQDGKFGVLLMKTPELVHECMTEMSRNVKIPCSVKCRLGVDNFDSYQFLSDFVKTVIKDKEGTSINKFVVHARNALLNGISPQQNRTIPPLQYQKVKRLKEQYPHLWIEINGGIKSIQQGLMITKQNGVDGFMAGRLAIENPFELRKIDYCQVRHQTPQELQQLKYRIIKEYIAYINSIQKGQVYSINNHQIPTPNMFLLIKPIINFYNGDKYSGRFRRHLSDLSKIKHKNLTEILSKCAGQMLNSDNAQPDFGI